VDVRASWVELIWVHRVAKTATDAAAAPLHAQIFQPPGKQLRVAAFPARWLRGHRILARESEPMESLRKNKYVYVSMRKQWNQSQIIDPSLDFLLSTKNFSISFCNLLMCFLLCFRWVPVSFWAVRNFVLFFIRFGAGDADEIQFGE
jgi:hypothetical protein